MNDHNGKFDKDKIETEQKKLWDNLCSLKLNQKHLS